MRKTSLVIAAVLSAVLAGLAIPAIAESEGQDEAACVSQPGEPAAGPIDLNKIPAKPVTGPQAVQGADDECDDVGAAARSGDDLRAVANAHLDQEEEIDDRD